jgi:Peptidase family M1 domain
MTTSTPHFVRMSSVSLIGLTLVIFATSVSAQPSAPPQGRAIYEQIKAFALNGGSAQVKGLVLQRDRARMTFDGTFYFATPVGGQVTGAVFVGNGKFSADVPPGEFEKENVKRLLDADLVESDFKTAVLRFSDNTFDLIGRNVTEGTTPDPRAVKLASELEGRILKETGANISARITLSFLNNEKPGFFFASFDGGRRERFTYLLDYQNRIPTANFGLNAGDKGIIFRYRSAEKNAEVWMAFASLQDYQRGTVAYSDLNDLIDITHYDLDLDLREHKKRLLLLSRVKAQTRIPNVQAVCFTIGEDLGEYEDMRLQKQLRIKKARVDGAEVESVQEDWEGGFTVFLSGPAAVGKTIEFELTLEGDFMQDAQAYVDLYFRGLDYGGYVNSFYPRSSVSWLPRHGYLDRSTFDMTYHHPKRLKIASVGVRLGEEPDPEFKDVVVTKYQLQRPVALVTFALGPFERHQQNARWDQGGTGEPLTIEFNSLPSSIAAIKEDFLLAEFDNTLRYFTTLFGNYPYPVFSATYRPFFYGQGFATMLLIPASHRSSKRGFKFIAHETAHQWWGNIVAWRSYRDQWLSEGFAEYSGVLYTAIRESAGARDDLLREMRESLEVHPWQQTQFAKERLVDVGPIILGHRLSTRKTRFAYQVLIYNKGALVLRMLHFLLSDPSTGNDKAFFTMMTDFVERYRDKSASTDDFRRVANEHFAKSPIAQQYRITNLDWFFNQWVYQAVHPSYRLEYQLENQADGKVLLTGKAIQEDTPEDWFMVLPVVFNFGGKQEAHATVHAYGPSTTFQMRLPARPQKVELDPDHWIIADNLSTKAN